MRNKVVLVNPYIHDFSAYDFWLKPLGLLYISSMLKEAGYEVHLIDLLDRKHPLHPKVREDSYGRGKLYSEVIEKPEVLKGIPRSYRRYGMPVESFKRILKDIEKPDLFIVTSMMTYWYTGVRETVEIIREIFPDVEVVVGGVYVTLMPVHARRNLIKARVIPGDERNLFDLLEMWGFKKLRKRPFSNFPPPDYSVYKNLNYISILSSRGCVFRCTYCATPLMWKYEFKDYRYFIDELKSLLETHKVKDVALFDDAFLYHPQIKEMLKEMKNLNVNFHTPNGLHVNRIDDEIAHLLKDAGVRSIYLSIESIKPDFFKKTGNKVKIERIGYVIQTLQKAGFNYGEVHAYILAGFPWQSVDDVKETIDFCIDMGVIPHVSEFTPVPGTEEYVEGGYASYDPLLLNNTLFPGWGLERGEEVKNYLKERMKRLKG